MNNDVTIETWGKNKNKEGITPAIAMVDPKFPHNVGAAVRAASCFGVKQVWFTGHRVSLKPATKKKGEKTKRLPREERMKGYKEVELRQYEYFFDQFPEDVTPVAIELRDNSEMLTQFEHPEKALYVFGPEDGGLKSVHLQHCHRFVVIPTHHCVNLAAAIYLVLYDRRAKRQLAGLESMSMEDILNENRGFIETSNDEVLYDAQGNPVYAGT